MAGCDRATAPQPAPRAAARKIERKVERTEPARDVAVEPAAEAPANVPPADVPPVSQQPQPVYRLPDQRPRHDESRLKAAGIQIWESKHLKLYTDIEPDLARDLPDLVDQIYIAWEASLGTLPPDRAGKLFQISGFLIRDLALFREHDLVPEGLILEHGRHLRNEFWMREQATDYYRRHLLLHEATHCFMTYAPSVNAPVWYLEGMAEHFATHHIDRQQRAQFCVMPTSAREFSGFGRIQTIRQDAAEGKVKTIPQIFAMQPQEFRSTDHYAWSWAVCAFLDGTPRYREHFRSLFDLIQGNQFQQKADELFGPQQRDLATEWALFSRDLQFGYDLTRAAIDFEPGTPFSNGDVERTTQVQANRGWQSTKTRLEAGREYAVSATGQYTLADIPKPWLSEPQGVSIRYFNRHPLGMLIGSLRTEEGPAGGEDEPMLQTIPLGRDTVFKSPRTGTLYLRVNDAWNSLDDNRGHADVIIRPVQSNGLK